MRRLFIILIVLTAAALAFYAYAAYGRPEPLPIYGTFPRATLVDSSGTAFGPEKMDQRVWVVDFIFTRCSGQCPIMTSQMYRLQQDVKGLSLLSLTVDPDYDTPEKLKAYAEMAQADPSRWFFATGDSQALNHILTELKMSKLGDPMMHSSRFVLVDAKRNVRGYYDLSEAASFDKLKQDAVRLLKEKR